MSLGETILIFVLAFVVLGPERMLLYARKAGQFAGQVRRQFESVRQSYESQVREDVFEPVIELNTSLEELRAHVSGKQVDSAPATTSTLSAVRPKDHTDAV